MNRIRPLLVALLLLLTACASDPASGDKSFTPFMSPEQERQIGAREHPRLVAEMGGVYREAALQAYVSAIGDKLVSVSETPDHPYTFTVIDSDDVNAFALPGGYVHVTRGLLALANSEAELAGVLAHEIGHVVARHSAQRYSQSVAVGMGAAIIGAIASAAGAPAGGDLAVFGAQAYLQRYSREQELEADRLAVRYLIRAGYDPQAMATFLQTLNDSSRLQAKLAGRPDDAADGKNIMALHPRTDDRVAQANRLAAQAGASEQREDRDTYLMRIDGIIYGDSPAQGLRIGRDFYHPGLRFTFRVPPDFIMINRPSQVIARGPRGSLIVFDKAAAPARRDPALYVGRDWGGRLDLTPVERIDVNGMNGATAAARVETRGGVANVRLVAIEAKPARLYRFIFLTPPRLAERLAPDLKQAIFSFRRLSEAEAEAVQPLRLRVTTVGPDDTVANFAANMAFADHQTERFLVLNRIDADEPLRPGRKVKIVARGGVQ